MFQHRSMSSSSRIPVAGVLLLVVALVGGACMAAPASDVETLRAALAPGHGPDHYWQAIERLGYEVAVVNYDSADCLEYEVVRENHGYAVQMELDEEQIARAIAVTRNPSEPVATAEVIETGAVWIAAEPPNAGHAGGASGCS